MDKRWTDGMLSCLLCILVGIFFWRLFFPTPNLIVTPDYGRSDAWHFSFPTKYALAQSLKSHTLPLWRNDIGAGFPLFAEGQTGALFIPNLLLFFLLPPVQAYNLALAVAVATLGVGVYLLCRTVRFSPLGSIIAGISVMFSGLTLTQLPHITLLQGTSLLPFIALLSIRLARHTRKSDVGLLAFFVSQQLYAGFPQATFLTYIFSGCIILWHAYQYKQWKTVFIWFLSVLLGIAGGALQLLPSWEFLRAGTDPQGFSPSTATAYSMPFIHLISFLSPFYFGNPATGTYPPFYAFDGSIFWENTAYMGILPIILLGGSIVLIKKRTSVALGWLFLLATLLLAAGKYGPTYLVYSIWPLTLFRVPSRFLWLSMVSIALISGYVITRMEQRTVWRHSIRLLLIILLVLHTGQVMHTWWSYHLILPAQQWLEPPQSAKDAHSGRVFTIGEAKLHNDTMTKTGWTNPARFYALRLGLSPNSNMLWETSQHTVYAGRYLKRPTLTDSLLGESITTNSTIATVSATTFLNLLSIRHVISFVPLDSPDLKLVRTISDADVSVSIYTNPGALPRAYFAREATTAATVREAAVLLKNTSTNPGQTVLLEKHAVRQHPQFTQFLSSRPDTPTNQSVTWEYDSHTKIRLRTENQSNSILVLTDTYYPGWTATVDEKPTPILAANLSQRAIFIPKGTHTVVFTYAPRSVSWGSGISIASLVIIVFLVTLPKHSEASRIQNITHGHAPHRRSIRRKS